MNQQVKPSNTALLIGLKQQLQKVLFNQQQLLEKLENHDLVADYNENNQLVFDTKTVPEMKNVLQGEYKKLENFEVVLAVVGTMKAGKSTTINAIVGREVLPNRNRPMTSLPTLIAHRKGQIEPVLTFDTKKINQYFVKLNKTDLDKYAKHKNIASYPEIVAFIAKIKKGYQFKSKYQGEQAIFDFLAELNDLVRLSRVISKDHKELNFPFSAYKEMNALPRIEVEFTELAQQNEQMGNLVLLDTPGPNEANLPELKEIFNQQLKRSSAVMVVMDYTQLKGQADADIRAELEKLPKIEKERLFALVNKFDQKNAHGDDENTTKGIIANDLLRNQIKIENVYCISAQGAFLSSRLASYIQQHQQKPNFDTLEWVQDFSKRAFGEADAQDDWEDASLEKINKRIVRVLERSQIKLPLNNVIMESYKNAPHIAMKSALADVQYIFTEIKNVFGINGRFTKEVALNEQELQQIKNTIKQLEEDIKTLKKDTDLAKVEIQSMSKKSIDEFGELFSAAEEASVNYVWKDILATIKAFKAGKETEVEEQKQFFSLDHNYRAERERLKKELKDLEKGIDSNSVRLRDTQMKKLNEIIANKVQFINVNLKENIKNDLNKISQKINQEIECINAKIVADMNQIKSTFGKEQIEIELTKLDMQQVKLSGDIHIDLLGIAGTETEDIWITTNRVTKWFGSIFGTKWGQEREEITYHIVSLVQLKNLVKDLSLTNILQPLQQQLNYNLNDFERQITEDIGQVENQAEKLKNELKQALKNEELPLAEKEERKAKLNAINLENQTIQKDIELVKRGLKDSFGEIA